MRKFKRSKFGSNFRNNQIPFGALGHGLDIVSPVGINFEGDGDGGGGGTGDGDEPKPITKDEMLKAISDAVSENTSKLTSDFDEKRKTLLAETKAAKEAAKQFDGMDIEQVKKMLSVYENDEEAKLIADGKIEEVIDKRVERIKADHESEKATSVLELETVVKERDNYKTMYEDKLVDIQFRTEAEKAGVLPKAIDDAVRRGADAFKIDTAGNLEARDANGELVKTEAGVLLSPKLFIEQLKTTHPYYWPQGQGSGATGATGDGGGTGDTIQNRMNAAAKSGDMTLYAKLRKEKKKNA